jgi:hypothetical protein
MTETPDKPKGKLGGARPGAGRKADPQRAANQAAAAAYVADILIPLLDELRVLATNRLHDPNVRLKAIRELLDRGLGKPIDTVDVRDKPDQGNASALTEFWDTPAE